MDHDHDHGGGGDMDMGHMMSMYFHAGTQETILFKFWETNSIGVFIASLVIVYALAFGYEVLKFYRDYLYEMTAADSAARSSLLGGMKQNVFKKYHLLQTVLHMVQLVLSYFLMLIFMTYNVWLGVAITLGAGSGYLLFGWNKRSAVDVTEHCH